jgi:hypothetical protein
MPFLFKAINVSVSNLNPGASRLRSQPPAHRPQPLAARLALALAALCVPLVSAGCGKTACFEWTAAEGTCPSQDEALIFFEEPFCGTNAFESIDSDGSFEDNACCYDVTENDDDYPYSCGDTTGVSVGVGPIAVSAVTSSSTVGVGGMGGSSSTSQGGAGGAGGSGGIMGCIRCGEAISGGDPGMLCSNSMEFYDKYMQCMCTGACAMACTDACMMMPMSMACQDCMGDTVSGCGNELSACANDL